MKKLHITFWLVSTLLATACSDLNDFLPDSGDEASAGTATFHIRSGNHFGISVSTRSDDAGDSIPAPEELGHLHYVITDADGRMIDHHQAAMAEDFSRLTLEGLKYGEYSIMFLASAKGTESPVAETPSTSSDPWIVNYDDNSPFDKIYYHKKIDFSIGFDHAPVNRDVELELAVAKVIVDFKVDNPSLWHYIKDVTLTLNDGVPSGLNADGTYSGSQQISGFGLSINDGAYSFLTFPSDSPVGGYIDVVSGLDGGDDFTTRYSFEGLMLKRGEAARIEIAYRHPAGDTGRLYIAEDQLWRFDTDTMFMADEPREVFYDNSLRSFYANAPLQFAVSSGKLNVHLYSPIGVRDIRLLARISSLSSEWFDLAHFEYIPPFMEGTFDLPMAGKSCLFKTTSGRNIRLPELPDLKATDIELKIETEDPFMAKISTIKSNWYIRYSKYSADSESPGYWRHMTPILCRHGVALALNMAFMFDSQEFSDLLDTYDGILKDNSGNAIDLNELRNKIRIHGGLQLGCVGGVGGLGGGQTYGLADYCYTGVYHDATAPDSNPHNYARQAMFHEYGHCLGYSHSSNMTYGDKWTVLCATAFVQLGREGKLPVPNLTDVTSLPMNRP